MNMRKSTKIPRIIKIHAIDGLKIYCAFNTGEHRILDFNRLFKKWKVKDDEFRSRLLNPNEFQQVRLHEGTLQWPNLIKKTRLSNGMEFEVMFDLDPLVLYETSEPDEARNKRYFIGEMLRKARLEAGLTQEELAKRSGTTKNYISRIENNKSDIELGTLIKIIEIGLDRELQIDIAKKYEGFLLDTTSSPNLTLLHPSFTRYNNLYSTGTNNRVITVAKSRPIIIEMAMGSHIRPPPR